MNSPDLLSWLEWEQPGEKDEAEGVSKKSFDGRDTVRRWMTERWGKRMLECEQPGRVSSISR